MADVRVALILTEMRLPQMKEDILRKSRLLNIAPPGVLADKRRRHRQALLHLYPHLIATLLLSILAMRWLCSITALLISLTALVLADSSRAHQVILSNGRSKASNPTSNMVLISDVLSRRDINIFSGLVRDNAAISKQLADTGFNATVLAPLNSEMTKMPRKPWEDEEQYQSFGANAYEGSDGQKRAEENLNRFVGAHVVVQSPWDSGEKSKTLTGKAVWWESKDGKQIVSRPCA